MLPNKSRLTGYSLIELMITVAIVAIIAAVAIPAYQGYIKSSHFAAARLNAQSLQLFLEDFFLDNDQYLPSSVTSGSNLNKSQLNSNFGWSPDGDENKYTYTVTVYTNTWDITVEHTGSGHWIRCEGRMNSCCNSDTSGASKTSC